VLRENDEKDREEAQKRFQARFDAAKRPDGTFSWPVGPDPTPEDLERVETFAQFPQNLQIALLIEDVDAINQHFSTLTREAGEALLKKIGGGGFLNIQADGAAEEA
jgi:hypothetical protein